MNRNPCDMLTINIYEGNHPAGQKRCKTDNKWVTRSKEDIIVGDTILVYEEIAENGNEKNNVFCEIKQAKAIIPVADVIFMLLAIVKKSLASGDVPINSLMPGAWLLKDYTAVAKDVIYKAMVTLKNNGVDIPVKTIWKILGVSDVIFVDDWAVIFIMTIETAANELKKYKVLQFRNDVLWNDAAKPEIYDLPIKLESIRGHWR